MDRFKDFVDYISQRHSGNVKYGLERMYRIFQTMGSPETKIRGIHIAGTNGKGSTSAMLEAISLSHSRSTGLNTSPHLIDYRERIRINGQNIQAYELIAAYKLWSDLFESTEASFFEITTALAFYIFAENNLHTNIIEVGLGGRLDGTNPFDSTVSIITSIAIDHPKTLGETIEKIAVEKAGIIKKGKPLVTGNLPKSALDVIVQVAKYKESQHLCYGKDFSADNVRISQEGSVFDYLSHSNDLILPKKIEQIKLNMIGKHQAHNASLAITAYALYCSVLNEEFSIAAVREGLQRVDWIGRMQIIDRKPLTILDCAHNDEGVESLVDNLKELFPGERFRIVVAILRDKSLKTMIERLCSIAEQLYISKNSSDRAADIEEQTEVAIACNTPFSKEGDIVSALESAKADAKEDEIVVVTGSIYTVSEVLKHIGVKRAS